MSSYYKPPRRRGLFDPASSAPFRLSRSRLDRFLECPHCFYVDRRLGVDRPSGPPFALNSAVDLLLKKEFDIHRVAKTRHPFMEAYGIDAIPYAHEQMDSWRDALRGGVTYVHPPTNFFVTGGVDDVWVNPQEELIVVDYKATSKDGEVSLDAEWQISYKRQMEVYQWLLRRNGFTVSDTGYFVYCNGQMDKEAFDGRLEFKVKLIPYTGSDEWIEPALQAAHDCLMSDQLPEPSPTCDFCLYRAAVQQVTALLEERQGIEPTA
jgi:hypothetical protein